LTFTKEEPVRKILIMIGISVFMATGFANAQESLKIGYVDMKKAMNDCKDGKAAMDKLEKNVKDKQAKLDKEKKKVLSMQAELEKKASVLSDQEKQDKQKEFGEEVQAYQKMVAEAQKEVNETQAKITNTIAEDIKKIIAAIAKTDNYTIIFEKTATSILYSKEGLDLTGKVIEKMDAKR
jgi:outer membrane protein